MSDTDNEKVKTPTVYYRCYIDDECVDITDNILTAEKFELLVKAVKDILIEFLFVTFTGSDFERLAISEKLNEIKFELDNVDNDFWAASYDNNANTVSCRKNLKEYEAFGSLIHELMHALSYFRIETFSEDSDIIERRYDGLTVAECRKNDDGTESKFKLNIGFNESVTEYFALIMRDYAHFYKPNAFPYFMGVFVVGILEEILGIDIIKDAYFFGETEALQKKLVELSGDEKCWDRLNKALSIRILNNKTLASLHDAEVVRKSEVYVDRLLEKMIEAKIKQDIPECKSEDNIADFPVKKRISEAFKDYIYSKDGAPSERAFLYDDYIERYISFKFIEKFWRDSALPNSCFDKWIAIHLCAFSSLNFNQTMDCLAKYANRSSFENKIRAVFSELQKERSDMLPIILDSLKRQVLDYDSKCFRYYDSRLIDDFKEKAELLKSKIIADREKI